MCPHATIYVSSCYHICVSSVSLRCDAEERAVSVQAVLLPHMCPHATIHVCLHSLSTVMPRSARKALYVPTYYICPHTTLYVSSYYKICVLILLYVCPHTTIYVSSGAYESVPRRSARAHQFTCRKFTSTKVRILTSIYVSSGAHESPPRRSARSHGRPVDVRERQYRDLFSSRLAGSVCESLYSREI